jgi:hypothetical protein
MVIHLRVKFRTLATCLALSLIMSAASLMHAAETPAGEAEVMAEAAPAALVSSAVEAVRKLGEQVVLGRYQTTLERMNPTWKQRTAARLGGMDKLERKIAEVPAEMVRQGISMISYKPEGQPIVHEVSLGTRKVTSNGMETKRMVFTKWLVLVPTVTRIRIISKENPRRPVIMEQTGFQVAISDKDKLDWTFIAGSELNAGDLRGLFPTLPQNMELPQVQLREIH